MAEPDTKADGGPPTDPLTDPLAETLASAGATDVEALRMRSAVKGALFGGNDPVRVGRYRLLDKLGEGGMGIVYKAHDDELDRDVAIKLLRPDGGGTAKRLLREARSMARLAHPHIAAVYDVGQHGESVYIAMEFVEGPSLRKWLATPRTFAEIRAVMLQAAEGLAAAHEAGVIHRDFKPDNVIVGTDGRVRVLDFGLAKLPKSDLGKSSDAALTEGAAMVGTPRYMAPEQLRQQAVSAATDQFAFSVSLYEAAFGSMPFAGKVFAEVVASVLTAEPTRPPPSQAVPDGLWPIVARGLSRDPAARFDSMRAVIDAVAALGDKPAEVVSRPALRDARDDAREQLGAAFAHSLISTDELDDRLEKLEDARSPSTVGALVADLQPEPPRPAVVAAPSPPQNLPAVVERPATTKIDAIFGSTKRNGDWRPGADNRATAVFGSVELDFRDISLPAGETTVSVRVFFGSVEITVSPGTRVISECSSIFGSVDIEDPAEALPPDAPTLRLVGSSFMGSVEVEEREIGEGMIGAWRRRRAAKKARRLAAKKAKQLAAKNTPKQLPPGS